MHTRPLIPISSFVNSPPVEQSDNLTPDALLPHVREAVPTLSALYRLAPSAHRTDARTVTLGVLYDGNRLTPLERWNASRHIADGIKRPVELTDLCDLALPQQLHLVGTASRLWARDLAADLYELSLRRERAKVQDHRDKFLAEITGAIEAAKRTKEPKAAEG